MKNKKLKFLVLSLMCALTLSFGSLMFAEDTPDPNGNAATEQSDLSGEVGIGFVKKSTETTGTTSTSTSTTTTSTSTSTSGSSSTTSTNSSSTLTNTNNNNSNSGQYNGGTSENKGITKYLPQTGEERRNFALVGLGIILIVVVLVVVYYKNKGETK